MKTVSIESRGEVAIMRLTNGVTNAINSRLVNDLSEAVRQVKQAFRGVVLAGGNKFFCIGLDLKELLQFDRGAMDEFWDRLDQVVLDLYGLTIPAAAAVRGHATAGGTILALTCDFRYIAAGRNLMGLNEVNIGVPVPYLADLMLRQVVSERSATRLMYGGDLIDPDQAGRMGLVDEVLTEEQVETRAVTTVAEFAAKPRPAFTIIKRNRVERVTERFARQRRGKKEEMLDCWFTPVVQEMLTETARKL